MYMDIEKRLENTISNLLTNVRKLEHNIDTDITNDLQTLYNIMLKASDVQLSYFREFFHGELQRMKTTISKHNRSFHDKIYNKLNMTKYVSHVTRMFEEFIKGITYFAAEEEKTTPIYHRMYACGPYANTHRLGNLVCSQELTKEELKRRRPLIERCYIERLIYDAIFREHALHFPTYPSELPTQDKAHIERLKLTKQDFETCFPDTTITCTIRFEDGIPIQLTITKQAKKKTVLLRFEKFLLISSSFGVKVYQENVECTKEDNGHIYIKTSRFNFQGKYTKLQ